MLHAAYINRARPTNTIAPPADNPMKLLCTAAVTKNDSTQAAARCRALQVDYERSSLKGVAKRRTTSRERNRRDTGLERGRRRLHEGKLTCSAQAMLFCLQQISTILRRTTENTDTSYVLFRNHVRNLMPSTPRSCCFKVVIAALHPAAKR